MEALRFVSEKCESKHLCVGLGTAACEGYGGGVWVLRRACILSHTQEGLATQNLGYQAPKYNCLEMMGDIGAFSSKCSHVYFRDLSPSPSFFLC